MFLINIVESKKMHNLKLNFTVEGNVTRHCVCYHVLEKTALPHDTIIIHLPPIPQDDMIPQK